MHPTHPTQLSITMFYGPKPDALQTLIQGCQQQLTALLGDDFLPYDLLQTHATLISLERGPGAAADSGGLPPKLLNRFFHELRGEQREMDLDGVLAYLRGGVGEAARTAFRVQLGGWQCSDTQDAPFLSQGQTPYMRSFSIQGDKLVLMGWPIEDADRYPNMLHALRQGCARFNLLHKYFRAPGDVDNDFYMRLGLLRAPLSAPLTDERRQQAEDALRKYLASRPPLLLDVTPADLHMVAYVDEPLSYANALHWPLTDEQLNADFLAGLYG